MVKAVNSLIEVWIRQMFSYVTSSILLETWNQAVIKIVVSVTIGTHFVDLVS